MFGVQRARSLIAPARIALVLAVSACAPAPATSAGSTTSTTSGDGTQNTTDGRTDPVPAPGGGTTDEVVETAEPDPVVEVGVTEEADLGTGVTAAIESVKDITVAAKTPGEIAGPAVAVELSVSNGSKKPIDLATAMVSLTNSDDMLGQPTTSDPYQPFTGQLEPGDTANGTFVFLLPKDARSGLVVSFQYVAGAPIALFAEQN